MTKPNLQELSAIATIIATGSAIVLGFRHYFARLFKALALLNPYRFAAAIDRIDREFKPNGGKSTFDKLATLGERQERMEGRQVLTSAIARATFRAQPGLQWLSRTNGEQEEATEDLVRVSGRTAEELRGHGWQASIHPEDRDRLVGGYLTALALGIDFEGHGRFLARVGRISVVEIPARIIATPTRIDGHVSAYIGRLFPDSSEEEIREAMEAALTKERQSEGRHLVNNPNRRTRRKIVKRSVKPR